MAYETNDSVWWEVEGLPPSGTWHGVYQARNEADGRRLLIAAVEDTGPALARHEDFRLTAPGIPTTPEDWHGYAWARPASDRRMGRKRAQTTQEPPKPSSGVVRTTLRTKKKAAKRRGRKG